MVSGEFKNAVKDCILAVCKLSHTGDGLWVPPKSIVSVKAARHPVLVLHFPPQGLGSNSGPWPSKLQFPSRKNGSGPGPTMPTGPARRSARGCKKAHPIPYAHHAHSSSPTGAWNTSTHGTASATGPMPSVRLPEMEAVGCAGSSCSLFAESTTRTGRGMIASYFGISETHTQRARLLPFSCLVSMG